MNSPICARCGELNPAEVHTCNRHRNIEAPEPLGSYSYGQLVANVMRNLSRHDRSKKERWVRVMDVFAVGSTCAHQICKHFGLDPEEKI